MADAQKIHPRVATVIEQDRGILENFGLTVQSAFEGACELSCVVPGALVNAAGFAHGSIAYSMMDTACAYALGSTEVRGVTINGNTTYIKGAEEGAHLTARVELVSRTRRIATLRGEVYVETEHGLELAAHGTFVFQLIEVRN